MRYDVAQLVAEAEAMEQNGLGPAFLEKVQLCQAQQLARIADVLERLEKLAQEKP